MHLAKETWNEKKILQSRWMITVFIYWWWHAKLMKMFVVWRDKIDTVSGRTLKLYKYSVCFIACSHFFLRINSIYNTCFLNVHILHTRNILKLWSVNKVNMLLKHLKFINQLHNKLFFHMHLTKVISDNVAEVFYSMLPFLCYHLSDNFVDGSNLYSVLSDLYIDLWPIHLQ